MENLIKNRFIAYCALLVMLFLTYCQAPEYPAPILSDITPDTGPPGIQIILEGKYLERVSSIFLGTQEVKAFHVDKNNNSIIVAIPENIAEEILKIKVKSGEQFSGELQFTVKRLLPEIVRIEPVVGKAGAKITIIGENFTGDTRVNFANKTVSDITYISPSALTVDIPDGTISGNVTLTTPTGTSKGEYHYSIESGVPDAPLISNVNPTEQVVGGIIMITGKNFFATKTTVTYMEKKLEINKDFKIVTEGQIDLTIPVWGESGKVTISNTYGQLSFEIRIIEAPRITKVIPKGNGPGGPLIIFGKNFRTVKEIQVGTVRLLSSAFKLAEDNGEDILVASVPIAPAGKANLKLKTDRDLLSEEWEYFISAIPVGLPPGLSSIVYPNFPTSPSFFGMGNSWLISGKEVRKFLKVTDSPIGSDLYGVIDGDNSSVIGYFKEDGSFISINLDGILYEGALDKKYGDGQQPFRVILTPLSSGSQLEMIFPCALDEISPSKVKAGGTIKIMGRHFIENEFNDYGNGHTVMYLDSTPIEPFNPDDPAAPDTFKWLSTVELEYVIPLGTTPKKYKIKLQPPSITGESNALEFEVIP